MTDLPSWIIRRNLDGSYSVSAPEGRELPPGSFTEVVSLNDLVRFAREKGWVA